MDWKTTAHAALNGDVRTIPLIDKTLTNEGQCADAKKTGDAFAAHETLIHDNSDAIAANTAAIQEANRRIDGLIGVTSVTPQAVVEAGVNGNSFPCCKFGHVCTLAFRAVTHASVDDGAVIFTDLPKPFARVVFYAFDFMDNTPHEFAIEVDGNAGVIKSVGSLASGAKCEGTVTYIAASDSAV